MAGIAKLPAENVVAPLPVPPSGAARFAINPAHVRTLLWLRWKLTVRGYTRNWRRVVGLVFTLLFFLWFAGVAGVGSAFAYLKLPRPAATELLFAVMVALYAVWAVLPLLQYSLNEGLDVTKLQTYPLTRGEQMVSLVLSTLFDASTLFIVALYGAVVVGWHADSLATIITIVALALAYVHTVGFSQFVLGALMGLLRSRRYRDLAVIIFAAGGSSCSLLNQLVINRFARNFTFTDPASLAAIRIDRYLQWTPPGMAARAITLANSGHYVEAVPWLLATLALVPVLLGAWAWVLDRGITNAEVASGATSGRKSRRRPFQLAGTHAGAEVTPARAVEHADVTVRRGRLIKGPALAIARKDALYLWRDPQLKAALLSALLATAFLFVPNLYGNPSSRANATLLGPVSVLFAPLPAVLVVLILAINAFGLERQALQTLFLFPLRPLDVFWGKNLVVGVLAFVLEVILTVIKAAITGGWSYIPLALAVGVASLLVLLGCGNITSVVAPFRARGMRMGETSTLASENGCLRSIISTGALVAAAVLLVPVGAAIAAPLIMEHREWLVITLPAAVLYGFVLYQSATRLIAPVLLRRAPEILAATVREA